MNVKKSATVVVRGEGFVSQVEIEMTDALMDVVCLIKYLVAIFWESRSKTG